LATEFIEARNAVSAIRKMLLGNGGMATGGKWRENGGSGLLSYHLPLIPAVCALSHHYRNCLSLIKAEMICKECGREFQSLGYARHWTAHYERRVKIGDMVRIKSKSSEKRNW
jgi:hypothetical protein